MADVLTLCPAGPYQGQPFHNPQPIDLTADTADWSSYADSVLLGSIGIFAIDAAHCRKKRDEQARYAAYVDRAYELLGTSRAEEYRKIARELAPKYNGGGIWVHSTGEYGWRCACLDAAICREAYGD